jgi:hypothetical protein
MGKLGVLAAALLACLGTSPVAEAQSAHGPKPECRRGAICFSGEVIPGREFSRDLGSDLVFELATTLAPNSGWIINIAPKRTQKDCDDFASVVNSPYRAHNQLEIDRSYGWTAEDETADSPREFGFVTNCADLRAENKRLDIVLEGDNTATENQQQKALNELGSSPQGQGRLWITDFRISHASDTADDKRGVIEWIRFTVEIVLPNQKPKQSSPAAR